jgi:hypothetical protein
MRAVLFLLVLYFTVEPAFSQKAPERLSDAEFWEFSTQSSETDGRFRSDNLVSNERFFLWALDDLLAAAPSGRVYMGVGPEQNFTYIAALKPKLAVILDIRRGNLDLHLMYKALFELSADRVEFVGRLLSRPRPEGLTAQSSIGDIFDAYERVPANPEVYLQNLETVWNHLTVKHGFALSDEDKRGIDHAYRSFYSIGPEITYNSTQGGRAGSPTYAMLMTATDQNGAQRSFLATEENFAYLRDLQMRNLIVPVIGDFAGPKAIRSVAAYLRGLEETVSAFYMSNVEDYLGTGWDTFCRNASTLPLDSGSTFIRSARGGRYSPPGATGLNLELNTMLSWLSPCLPAKP